MVHSDIFVVVVVQKILQPRPFCVITIISKVQILKKPSVLYKEHDESRGAG